MTAQFSAADPRQSGTFEKPDPKAIRSWRFSRLIRTGVFLAVTAAVLIIMRVAEAPGTALLITGGILGAVCLYSIISTFVFPAIEYRQWEYRIEADKVTIRHGIFFIKTDVIPMIRIQNVTTSQGPIDRHFGLVSVTLALASGTFDIRCLSKERADEICSSLNERLHERIREKGVL